ncbi:MAG: hypothetical protein NTY01_05700 [Verrucomicrobia bacterium]|nr:hypothetical protein [Verrucomicrobiota bacterium]
MKTVRGCFLVAAGMVLASAAAYAKICCAGAFAMAVAPTNFPAIVNGGFPSKTTNSH